MSKYWESAAYTRRQWFSAVGLSSLLGWLAISLTYIWHYRGEDMSQHSLEATIKAIALFATVLFLSSLFLSCIIMAPALRWLMLRQISWRKALLCGLGFGATLYVAVLFLLAANASFADRNITFDLWQTPLGLFGFCFVGIVVSAVVRAFLGPGSQKKSTAEHRS